MCTFNEATKILRKEVAGCPLAAARAIIQGLLVDTGRLLSKSGSYCPCHSQVDHKSQARPRRAISCSASRVAHNVEASSSSMSSSVWSTIRLNTQMIRQALTGLPPKHRQAHGRRGTPTSAPGMVSTDGAIGIQTLRRRTMRVPNLGTMTKERRLRW